MSRWLACLLLACAALACTRAPERPLLLLVTVDTLRADHLGANGGPPGISPNFDSLAAESLRFDAAYAPASYTLPSIASLLSGLYPEEVGILANINLFRASSVTLAEILRLNGWRTGAAVSNHVLRGDSGIEKGFDVYDDTFTRVELNRGKPERTAEHTTDAALAVLDGIRKEPSAGVFLWVHYQDAHGPYTPPGERRERFMEAASRAPGGERELPIAGINALGAIPEYQVVDGRRDVAFYRAGYAGEIQFIDEEFGRLVDGLDQRGLWRDAMVVFTADHGESFGEDDYWFAHGAFLSDALVHVPLFVRDPAASIDDASPRTDVVSLVDLLPTLVSRFGIAPPRGLPGRNLFAEGADRAGGSAYIASLLGGAVKHYGWVEDGYKYLLSFPQPGVEAEELHALADPGPDRIGEEGERRAALRARLESFRKQLDIAEAVEQELTPHDREMLRRLGYLESGG